MKRMRKAFLYLVGVIFIAFDELEKSVEEAIEAVEEQSGKLSGKKKPTNESPTK